MKELVRYIHLNPLRARLVADYKSLKRFGYGGHCALAGKRQFKWQNTQEQLERRYHLMAKGYDFDWLVGYVATVLGVEQNIVTRPGRYPDTVEARSVLCYWATWNLGISTIELSKRLNVSQPTASQSAKRGEKIVRENKRKRDRIA